MLGEIDEPRFPCASKSGPRLIARERTSAERNGRFDRAQSISMLRYANQTSLCRDGFTAEARINRSFDIGGTANRADEPLGNEDRSTRSPRVPDFHFLLFRRAAPTVGHSDSCQSQITFESRSISGIMSSNHRCATQLISTLAGTVRDEF